MAYGSVKVDSLIYDSSGSDVALSVSGIPSASAINAKAPLASPTFTGTVTIPSGANIAGYATTASPAFTSDIELSAQAPLKFMDADSSHYVGFKAPTTVSSNVTWTLPSSDGASGTFLSTNGSGTLSWAAPSGGASIGIAVALG